MNRKERRANIAEQATYIRQLERQIADDTKVIELQATVIDKAKKEGRVLVGLADVPPGERVEGYIYSEADFQAERTRLAIEVQARTFEITSIGTTLAQRLEQIGKLGLLSLDPTTRSTIRAFLQMNEDDRFLSNLAALYYQATGDNEMFSSLVSDAINAINAFVLGNNEALSELVKEGLTDKGREIEQKLRERALRIGRPNGTTDVRRVIHKLYCDEQRRDSKTTALQKWAAIVTLYGKYDHEARVVIPRREEDKPFTDELSRAIRNGEIKASDYFYQLNRVMTEQD